MRLVIEYREDFSGLQAECSACGKVLQYASACNEVMLTYAENTAKREFEKHKTQCRKKPKTGREKKNRDVCGCQMAIHRG